MNVQPPEKRIALFRIACPVVLMFLAVSPQPALSSDNLPSTAIADLTAWLEGKELDDGELESLAAQPFASLPLSRDEAVSAGQQLWAARREFLRADRKAEMEARELVIGELKMPFWYKIFGDEPARGRSLYISMHGGGGAPAALNDQQYENQKKLYQPAEGVYLVPRAASNTWDLWHQAHIDQFFDRLITDLIVFENVNPDRVYIMGYSAGGDGVYQLAPRMADRLAAAAMMAGHPNESRPEGLRNIGFTIHMGALDAAYNRNAVAAEWGKKLDALEAADPEGYVHEVTLHEGRGHWMNLQDAVAVPWMAKFTRNVWPKKVVWVQDNVCHSRFYWLEVDGASARAGDEIIASVDGNSIHLEKYPASRLTLLLDDRLLNLDQPVRITRPDGTSVEQNLVRTIAMVAENLKARNDPAGLASATAELDLTVATP